MKRLFFPLAATRSLCVLAAAVALGAVFPANAAYPERPVKVVVSFAAGGPADLIARHAFSKLSSALGQSFIVENRAGAGGNIGAQAVASAAPDGYTLLMIVPAHAINMTLYAAPGYDSRKDFVPVAPLAKSPLVLLSKTSAGYGDLAGLLGAMRERKTSFSYGSSGVGTPPHLGMELLRKATGGNLVHVPYRGGAPALNDLMGGQIDLMFDAMLTGMKAAESGRVRALGVSGANRSSVAPSLPTLLESGLPGFEVYTWYGIAAPAGTPPDIVALLNRELTKVVRSDAARHQYAQWGVEPMEMSPEEFAAFFSGDVNRWGEAVTLSGAKAE